MNIDAHHHLFQHQTAHSTKLKKWKIAERKHQKSPGCSLLMPPSGSTSGVTDLLVWLLAGMAPSSSSALLSTSCHMCMSRLLPVFSATTMKNVSWKRAIKLFGIAQVQKIKKSQFLPSSVQETIEIEWLIVMSSLQALDSVSWKIKSMQRSTGNFTATKCNFRKIPNWHFAVRKKTTNFESRGGSQVDHRRHGRRNETELCRVLKSSRKVTRCAQCHIRQKGEEEKICRAIF